MIILTNADFGVYAFLGSVLGSVLGSAATLLIGKLARKHA